MLIEKVNEYKLVRVGGGNYYIYTPNEDIKITIEGYEHISKKQAINEFNKYIKGLE